MKVINRPQSMLVIGEKREKLAKRIETEVSQYI